MTVHTFSVASVNVNGIRAAYRKGMADWLDYAKPDIVLLQEVRAEEEIAVDLLGDGFTTFVAPSQLKGRAGVAVAVSNDSRAVGGAHEHPVIGLAPLEDAVDSGRWLEVDVETTAGYTVRVVSAYFHSGQINHPRQEAKMRHLAGIDARMKAIIKAQESLPRTLVGGDFNVVRSERDIKNWKPNYNKTSGVLDEEIAFLNGWLKDGWQDVVRDLAGDQQGPYSWWSWRGKAFDNDAGWRIDYHYATRGLASGAVNYRVDRAKTWDTRFSDHAPVVVTFEV